MLKILFPDNVNMKTDMFSPTFSKPQNKNISSILKIW